MPALFLSRLRSVLLDKGINPRQREITEAMHRKEWPLLWAALDELMQQDANAPDRGPEYYDALGKFQRGPRPVSQLEEIARQANLNGKR